MSRGVRFAPSPTGAFHVGNFRTAWISWRWARALGEPWVLRFEDIDQPRVVAGARERQEAELRRLGLAADRILVQSELASRHWQAFERAVRERQVYPCFCSRKDVRDALEGAASAPHGADPVYSGHCRALGAVPEHRLPTVAWRFKTEGSSGRQDFIVGRTAPEAVRPLLEGGSADAEARASFVPAYHWACAIDDADGDYRLLARAWDLAPAAEQQRAIQRWLGGAAPWIYHCALVTGDLGERLEKRTRGVTLPELEAQGVGPEALVRLFERSFERYAGGGFDERSLGPGLERGEARRSISLSELGLERFSE